MPIVTGLAIGGGLLVAAPTASLATEALDNEVLYTEDFERVDQSLAAGDNAGLGWHFTKKAADSTARIRDGRLYLSGNHYDTVHYTGGSAWKDYVLEADYGQTTSTGWGGLLYRAGSGTSFQKAGLGYTKNASLNGFNDGWVNDVTGVNRVTVTESLQQNKPLRMRVAVRGGASVLSVAHYQADGTVGAFREMMSIDNIPSVHELGSIGLMVNSTNNPVTEAWIDNIEVRHLTPAEETSWNVPTINVPETAIVNPPAIIGATDYAGRLAAEDPTAPAVQMLDVDAGLDLDAWFEEHGAKVIPAFRVDSAAEAATIADYVSTAGIVDAMVVSDEPSLVRQAREAAPMIRGVLEYDGATRTNDQRKAAKRLADDHLANVVLLPEGTDGDDIAYFNARMITVWANAADSGGVHRAIAAGYNGVVTDPALANRIYTGIDTPTLSGKPLSIGHRGFTGTSIYPENTLLGFRKAQEIGTNIVEIDLRMSKDGEIVLIHDTTVDRTVPGRSGAISSFTTEELTAMDVVAGGHSDKVPTLEQALQEFQGEDFVFALHVNIVTAEMAERLNELLAKYDMHDQVVVFVSVGQTTHFNPEVIPHVSFALGSASDPLSTTNEESALKTLIKITAPINYQPLPYSYPVASDWGFYYKLGARGLLSWLSTKSSREEYEQFMITKFGAVASLNNDPRWASAIRYEVSDKPRTVRIGQELDTACDVLAVRGSNHGQECSVELLSGDALADVDGELTAKHEGTARVVLAADVSIDRGGPTLDYRVYSEPVTVTVTPAEWVASRRYAKGDRITYEGSIWEASRRTAKTAPGRPHGPWQEMVTAADGTAVWTASRIFTRGDIVTHDGDRYEAKRRTRNQEPGRGKHGPWRATSNS